MSMRNVLLCALIALGSVTAPAVAAVNINIDLGVAPPAPRYEVVPAPRSGYTWAPGYWSWEGQRHNWAPGRWIEARPGSYWVADRWEPRDGRHHFKPGRWEGGSGRGEPGHKGKGNGKGWAKGHDR
jgi:hypothetical protein